MSRVAAVVPGAAFVMLRVAFVVPSAASVVSRGAFVVPRGIRGSSAAYGFSNATR